MHRFEWTRSKLKDAAFHRKQRRERDRLALFADQVSAAQELEPSCDEVMDLREKNFARLEKEDRSRRASLWIQARRSLRALPEPLQSKVLVYWQDSKMPGDPSYLATCVHSALHGRLIVDPPTAVELAKFRSYVFQKNTEAEENGQAILPDPRLQMERAA